MPRFSVLISIFCLLSCHMAQAQTLYPEKQGDRTRCSAMIEMPKGYLSGVCMMYNDGTEVRGSIFNEFGISAISFSYNIRKDKVKLIDVISMIDKWYIKKILRKDMRTLMHRLREGNGEYVNEKYKISYKFSPLTDDSEEQPL